MLTKGDIEGFYKHVEALGLKFPVAAIAEATGQSKSNVSKYLNRRLEPSETFLKAFYERFPKEGKNVSRENGAVDLIKEVGRLNDQQITIEATLSVILSEIAPLIASATGRSHASVFSQMKKDISIEIENLKTLGRKLS